MEDNKIVMIMDDGQEVEFTILDSCMYQGNGYILVTDAPEEEDGECYIMKDVSAPEDEEAIYESVADDAEADAVFEIFKDQLKDDIDIE